MCILLHDIALHFLVLHNTLHDYSSCLECIGKSHVFSAGFHLYLGTLHHRSGSSRRLARLSSIYCTLLRTLQVQSVNMEVVSDLQSRVIAAARNEITVCAESYN